jgi:hypothetical protein
VTGPLKHLVGGVLTLCLASACAGRVVEAPSDSGEGVEIDSFVIRNELPFTVTDVYIESPETGNFAGCGTILPKTECQNTFPARAYRRNGVIISWNELGVAQSTGEFVVEVPDGLQPGQATVLEVIIYSRGQAGARLIQ